MFRDILSSKWVLAGFFFCILMVAGSLFYSWHVERGIKADETRTQRFLEQLETKKETRTAQDVGVPTDTETLGQTSTPLETDPTQMMSDKTDAFTSLDADENLDMADAFLPDEITEEDTTEVPVSPFGFGPYPEVPAGLNHISFPAATAEHELLQRVRIKLFSQGINTAGANIENGLIYPIIKGTVYVKWKSYWRQTGKVTYISDVIAHPEDGTRLEAIRFEKGKSLIKADVPPDIKLVSFEEAAINPYTFLNLPQGGKQ